MQTAAELCCGAMRSRWSSWQALEKNLIVIDIRNLKKKQGFLVCLGSVAGLTMMFGQFIVKALFFAKNSKWWHPKCRKLQWLFNWSWHDPQKNREEEIYLLCTMLCFKVILTNTLCHDLPCCCRSYTVGLLQLN